MKKKLVIFSDSPDGNTGFSNEIVPLLPFLSKKYEVHYVGVFGLRDFEYNGVPIYGAGDRFAKDMTDNYGYKRFAEIVTKIKPDFVFANQDLQYVHSIASICAELSIPLINWNIIDCDTLPAVYYQLSMIVDWHIYQTKFAKLSTERSIRYLKYKDFPVIYPPVRDVFFKRCENGLKRNDKPLVLCVAKNIPRKFISTLIEGIALLGEYQDRFSVVIHSIESSGTNSVNLREINGKFMNKNVVFTQDMFGKPMLSEEELAKLYQSADVFILPSGREGVGLPFLEAMASKVFCIGVQHSAVSELLAEDRGMLLSPVAFQYEIGGGNITNAIITPVAVAESLYNALFNKDIKENMEITINNAHKFVNHLRSSIVADKLIEQFELCYEYCTPRRNYLRVLHVMP